MSANPEPRKGLVSPRTLKGFQDLLPQEIIARNAVIEKIRGVYEIYGFVPLDTPVLEYLSTLIGTGGDETNKKMFRLESPEHEAIVMRYDLTVAFARLLAQYPEHLKLPFRRYQIGPVFRADDPGPTRLRQFTQFDIDAAGSESMAVDAEIVAAMSEVMRELGLRNPDTGGGGQKEFEIQVNNRKLVDALLEPCGICGADMQKHVLRVVDKRKKIGIEDTRRELGDGRVDTSGDPIPGVGLRPPVIEKILSFIDISANSRGATIDALAQQLPKSARTQEALKEMRELDEALEALGVAECDAVFDPSLARGLDYYTGPVFEAVIPSLPEIGSFMGGGRFDNLVGRFLDGSIPSTGASIGLERLMAALHALGKLAPRSPATQVIVLTAGLVDSRDILGAATELRREGIRTEIYFGSPHASLRDQFSLANARQIPIALVVGEDELKNGTVSLKNLRAGMEARIGIQDRESYRQAGRLGQTTVQRVDLVRAVRELLETYKP